MEHQSNNLGPSAELPQPQADISRPVNESSNAAAPEVRGMVSKGITPVQSTTPTQASNLTQPVNNQTYSASPSAVGHSTTDLIADDADLIEKEWVAKAKAIVAHTKDDPHMQNNEMNKVKADYLKKRYNKDLKVSNS